MFEELFEEFEGAYAENTITGYRSDLNHYENWCTKRSIQPIPAEEAVLAEYINDMALTLKSATIRRRIGALNMIFELAKLPNPTRDKEVVLALKRMHRSIGRYQQQAAPLTLEYVRILQAACELTVRGKRDELMLQLGYESMRRRSEIVSFKFENLKTLDGNRYGLLLEKSKTDQQGTGKLIPISNQLAGMIHDWADLVGEQDGYILRRMERGEHVGKSMKGQAISLILKRLQRRARLTHLPPFSGHSFRVGAALDLLNRGVPLEKIMLRGGWRSETTALKYLRSWTGDDIDLLDDLGA